MSVLSRPYFHDEAAAFAHVEGILWPQGPVCHHCGAMERIYALKGVRTKPTKKHPNGIERFGLYKCGECRKQFTQLLSHGRFEDVRAAAGRGPGRPDAGWGKVDRLPVPSGDHWYDRLVASADSSDDEAVRARSQNFKRLKLKKG